MSRPDLVALSKILEVALEFEGDIPGSVLIQLGKRLASVLAIPEVGFGIEIGAITPASLIETVQDMTPAQLQSFADGIAQALAAGTDTSIETILTRFEVVPEDTRSAHMGAMMPGVNPGEKIEKEADGDIIGWGFSATDPEDIWAGTPSLLPADPESEVIRHSKGSSVASASTIVLGDDGHLFHVTGTTTINNINFLTDRAGRAAFLIFDGVLQITDGAALISTTGANIDTEAGDLVLVISDGSDVVYVAPLGAAGGGGLADGDYGAFTVTGGVASLDNDSVETADITNDAVTYAKIQNISAQYRILGRSTAGAGDTEEVASSANMFSLIGAATYAAARTQLGLDFTAQYKLWGRVSSGAGALEEITSSANVFSILGAANYAAIRALLDLEVGTDFNAYSAVLNDIAGQTIAADSLLYGDGASSFAVTTLTSYARTLLDDANAAAAATTLGLGTGNTPEFTGLTLGGVPVFTNIPQNSQSAAYTLVLGDAQKHIFHPSADTTARTWTIPANSSVAFPIGTAITFVNQNSAGVITIAITTDTMRLAGAGTTGSRSLAANGIATAVKVTSTEWIISGTGLT